MRVVFFFIVIGFVQFRVQGKIESRKYAAVEAIREVFTRRT